ncbi:oxidoreductase [uncultured Aquimonas sp.]|uniref:oxidoreductase n=1 Tax=uncultured Aquimonas sp. TaxID=385483 RepID=UPI00086DDA9E|nr:oxidoreductase [uncultured Aquimonas sp.]ODU45200.1 MAG: oxidoreductase [Xanthomonadaceae bacterium SCN 69-123]
MTQIQVGLLGFGLAGSVFHAPLIQACDGLHLAAVGSRSFEGKQLPAGVCGASIDAVLADPAIELIVVATPNDSHASFARQALLAGKHVVVDKPFVLRAADAEDLIALARKQDRRLSVFHNRRWDADFLTAQQVMAEGRLGKISYAEFHFDRCRPQLKPRWREQPGEGAGVLYDLGPHLIDQACCLFGLPRAVTADVLAQRPGAEVDDYFHLLLDYGSTRVVLHASSLMPAHGPRIALYGEAASFRHFGLDSQEDDLKAGLRPGSAAWGQMRGARAELLSHDGEVTAIDTLRGRYQDYYAGIVHAVRTGAEPPVTATQALDVMRVLEAAMRSSAERRTVLLG